MQRPGRSPEASSRCSRSVRPSWRARAPSPRRAVHGAGADLRRQNLRDHPGDQRPARRSARRAERAHGARRSKQGIRSRDRAGRPGDDAKRCARTSRFARRISARAWPAEGSSGGHRALARPRRPRRARNGGRHPPLRPQAGRRQAGRLLEQGDHRVRLGRLRRARCTKKRRTCWRTARRLVVRHLGRAGLGRPDFPAAGIDVLLTPLDDDILTRSKDAYATEQRAAVVMPLEDGAPTFVREGEREDVDEPSARAATPSSSSRARTSSSRCSLLRCASS